MLIGLKTYVGDKNHETTSWYLFEDSDTRDKSKALWSIEDSEVYRDVLDKDISVPDGETYYILAVRNFDDDSTEEALKQTITQYDAMDIFPIDMVKMVESPNLRITANSLSSGGELTIVSSEIRPSTAIFDRMSVITYANGRVIDAVDCDDYTYNLNSAKIPSDSREVMITASHYDKYGSMSAYGFIKIKLKNNVCVLRNKLLIPTLRYKPILITDKDFQFRRLELIQKNKIIYKGERLEIPEDKLDYGEKYILVIYSYIDGETNIDRFNIQTISKYTRMFDENYEYGYFQESDMNITEVNGKYDTLQNNKCFIPIDKDKYAIKFLNSDANYYKSNYDLDNEPDFNLPITILNISQYEVMFFYIAKSGDNIMVKFHIEPTLYRAIKVNEAVVDDSVVSDIVYSDYDEQFYCISKNDDKYYISTISLGGSVDTLYEVIETTDINDNLYLVSNSNKIFIVGGVDGFMQYTIDTGRFQVLKQYDDNIKDKELVFYNTINGGLIIFVKSNKRILLYDFKEDEITEFESPLDNITRTIELPNGSYLLKNDNEQIIFK